MNGISTPVPQSSQQSITGFKNSIAVDTTIEASPDESAEPIPQNSTQDFSLAEQPLDFLACEFTTRRQQPKESVKLRNMRFLGR
jgi:hypothetical protein